jgi:hypothetical protein
MELWASSGAEIRRLFAGGPTHGVLQTKLWDFGNFPQGKRLLRLSVMAQAETGAIPLTITVENESGRAGSVMTELSSLVTWEDETGAPVTWEDETATPVTWLAGGLLTSVQALPVSGNWLGVRVEGTGEAWTLGGLAMEFEPLGEWTAARG